MYSAVFATALTGLAVVHAAPPINGVITPGVTGKLGNAAIVEGNPVGVTYTAVLPNSPTTGVRGYVAGTSNANGTGVNFNVNFYGFPDASLGPFCTLLYSSSDIVRDGYLHPSYPSVPHSRPASPCQWQLHCHSSPPGPLHSRRDSSL